MRWSGLLAAAALLGSGVPAHAQYDNRLGELQPEIRAFGHPALVQSIQGDVENEFEARNDALEEAREDYLQAEGPQALQEQWLAYHQQQAEQRTKKYQGFHDAAEDIIERDGLGGQGLHPALLWIARVRQEQFAFQIAVKSMPLAQLRDLLKAKTDLYTQSLSNLENQQSTLESNANSAASSARSYRQALLTACTDLRRIKTEAERDLGRVSTEIVPGLTPDQAEDFRDGLRGQIDRLIGDIQLFQSRTNVALNQVQGIDGQAMALGKIVLAKRQAVQTVRDNFNLKTAETQFALQLAAARDQIDQINPTATRRTSRPTSAMRRTISNPRSSVSRRRKRSSLTASRGSSSRRTTTRPTSAGSSSPNGRTGLTTSTAARRPICSPISRPRRGASGARARARSPTRRRARSSRTRSRPKPTA